MRRRIGGAILMVILCAGCGRKAATIDASSDESLKRSIETLTADMTADEADEFAKACMTVMMGDRGPLGVALESEMLGTNATLRKRLDGLTVEEVHAKAEEIRKQVRSRLFAARPDQPEKPPPAPIEWADAFEGVERGDVRVRVLRARLGKVKVLGFDGEALSDEAWLAVTVEITNVSDIRKLKYTDWGEEVFPGDDATRLEDDHGNTYGGKSFGLMSRPAGRNPYKSVYPSKSLTDLLVFELPVEKASELRLTLPLEKVGGEGLIHLRIPMVKVTR